MEISVSIETVKAIRELAEKIIGNSNNAFSVWDAANDIAMCCDELLEGYCEEEAA